MNSRRFMLDLPFGESRSIAHSACHRVASKYYRRPELFRLRVAIAPRPTPIGGAQRGLPPGHFQGRVKIRKFRSEHFSTAVPQKADVVLNSAKGSSVPTAEIPPCAACEFGALCLSVTADRGGKHEAIFCYDGGSGLIWITAVAPPAEAAPCLLITLTGTQSGPATFNGQAGAGTLISFGDDSNDCGTVKLLVDAGRGTNMRLSQLNVTPVQLNALFFTHMHSDRPEGFTDIMQHRWTWNSRGPKLDIVCSADVTSQFGFSISCQKFVAHIGDAFMQSGEIAQRRVEGGGNVRLVGGPAELANVITFKATEEPQAIWSLGDVKVSAINPPTSRATPPIA